MTSKLNDMQSTIRIFIAAMVALTMAACGNNTGQNNVSLADKKAELVKLKSQVKQLETDIAALDTSATKGEKAKLVTLVTLAPESFTHYIDLQGKIESENISYIAPRNGVGGVVKALYVKRGDKVKKGQLLLKLDDAIARQSLITAEQGLETIKTQLSFARALYQKQKNLWDENIGTEVQLITAKNSMENIENQLKSAREQLKITKEQLEFTNVLSDVDGVAETVNVRVGEIFAGATASGSQIVIVNNSHLKATAAIPENYLGKVNTGSHVIITLPDINKTIDAVISVMGKAIDANTRSFFIEAIIPADKDIRPNQIALVKIQDYTASNILIVPLNTLQNDEKGKFVMVAVKENGKTFARKRPVTAGDFYDARLEIKSGLQAGDLIIADGYQGLYDGQLITTEVK
jgi:membrane fusion protein, multidrug efflux system